MKAESVTLYDVTLSALAATVVKSDMMGWPRATRAAGSTIDEEELLVAADKARCRAKYSSAGSVTVALLSSQEMGVEL